VMDNFFPGTSDVSLRPGSEDWLTDLPNNARAFLPFNTPTGGSLFVSTDAGIYDATSSGVVGTAETSCTDGDWQSVSFINTAGPWLVAVNGVDYMKNFDGTTWTDVTGASTPAITGVDTRDLVNLCMHKRRLWFVEANSMDLWYLAVDAIGGAATRFPVGPIFPRGGYAVACASWTIDGGNGVDDLFAVVTSEGELAVYQGTDPSATATWALIGVYYVGEPIGSKCLTRFGGDLLYISKQGVFPLSKQLLSATVDRAQAVSFKIDGAFLEAAASYGNVAGWEATVYPGVNALIINIPIVADSLSYQYVMNNITKAWCNFTGQAANCWTIFDNEPYWGGNGFVAHAWDDNYANDTSDINGYALQAFNYFDARGVKKYFTRARPSIFTNGVPSIFIGLNMDFDLADTTAALSFSPQVAAKWDVALWDVGYWATDTVITNNWQGVTGIGYCAATQFKTASQGTTILWASTDIVYQQGWAGI